MNTWAVDGTVVQTGGTTFTLGNITADHTVLVTFTVAVVSAVTLTAVPSAPQLVNTPITLTTTPTTNGGQVEYLFRAGYIDAVSGDWVWANLTPAYSTSASCTWTPTQPAAYAVVVWAREVGHSANYDQNASLPYQVNLPALTHVTLGAMPAAPQFFNTAITLDRGGHSYRRASGISVPGRHGNRGRLGVDESHQHLHHLGELHLDAGDPRQLHAGGVGPFRGRKRQL